MSEAEDDRWHGKMEAMLEQNTESTRRLEIKLLGTDGDPDSGLVANIARRVAKLEADRVRLGVVLVIGMGAFHILGEHLIENWVKSW